MGTSDPLRRRPQQARSQENVRRMLESTQRLIIDGGLSAVSIASVAAESGVAPATVYQFFDNRDALVRSLVGDVLQALDERFATVLHSTDPPVNLRAAVAGFFVVHDAIYLEQPALVEAYYAARDLDSVREAVNAHLERLALLLHQYVTSHAFLAPTTPLLPVEVAVQLGDHLIALAHRSVGKRDLMLDEGVEIIYSYLASKQ